MTRRVLLTAAALPIIAACAAILLLAITIRRPGYDDEDTPDTVRETWMRNRRNR